MRISGSLPACTSSSASASAVSKPGDAERRAIELDFFARRLVRRVVGGDGIHGAVGEAFDAATARSSAEASGGFILKCVS